MKKVLLVTDVNFWEKSSGNRARIYRLVQYLSGQVQLTVVNTGPAPQNIEEFLSKKFAAEFFVLEKTKIPKLQWLWPPPQVLFKGQTF